MIFCVLCAFILCTFAQVPPNLGQCNGTNWDLCRLNFMNLALGYSTLPTQDKPDFIFPMNYNMSGFPTPGTGSGGNFTWKNGLQKLVWVLQGKFITLNATVFYSFNTSGDAVSNYPPENPNGPKSTYPDYYSYLNRGDTLILYHNGHETKTCVPNYDGVVDYFNELGYDVMEFNMPLIGCNEAPQYNNSQSHEWFYQWELKGEYTIRFFVEPVFLAVNYAVKLGYKNIIMVGLSGGGWTTTVASAIDTRIQMSFPIAGSIPKFHTNLYPYWIPDLPEGKDKGEGGGGDYEQSPQRPMYQACGFVCMYALAANVATRFQLQILHEWDSCCFRAVSMHTDITRYNFFVQSKIKGWMQTAVTTGNYHQVNLRDKLIVGYFVELFRKRNLRKEDFVNIPFDILQVQNFKHEDL